jgi:integrase
LRDRRGEILLNLVQTGLAVVREGKRDMLVFDDEQRGLGVRVRRSAAKPTSRNTIGTDRSGASRLEIAAPYRSLPVAATERRERVLTDAEVAAIWRSTASPGPFNGIVRMLLLTGQRREEAATMKWGELSDDTWTVPASRAKNGATHIVPLSTQAQDLLRGAPRLGELVFPGLRGPFNGFSKAKAALDAGSGVTGWRLHDLRRTVATGLQRLGVRLEVTEQILNHVSGSRAGIVGVYQRHDFAVEKRAALEAWDAHVQAIVEGRETSANVIALRA